MKIVAAVVLSAIGVTASLATDTAATVPKRGQHGTLKLEHLLARHLSELYGRYKLRVTQVTYDPAGFIGEHHHVGPGIRCVTAGELTYVQADQTTVYRAGNCFFEPGDVTHTAYNRTAKPVTLLNFEVLPAAWDEGSAIPVPN